MEGRGTVWTPFRIAHSRKKKYLDCVLCYSKRWSGDSVIGILMRSWAGQPRGCVSVYGNGSVLFSSPELPDRPWIPSYLLLNRYRLFFAGKRPELKLITRLRLMSKLTTRASSPLPHMSSFLSQGYLYLYLASMIPRITLLLRF